MGAGLAALVALAASVTHPENLLAIGAVFAQRHHFARRILHRDLRHMVQHDRTALPARRKAGTADHAASDAEFVCAVHCGRIGPARSSGEPLQWLRFFVGNATNYSGFFHSLR